MIKTILIDDEEKSLISLSMELAAYCPQIEIIGQYVSPIEGGAAIRKLAPDLVFLDIHMPKMNGFELLESFTNLNFHVIFVTAFDEYAVRAFDFNALAYIMKPVRKAKLIQAVEKVESEMQERLSPHDLKALLNNLRLQQDTDIQTIAIPTNAGYEMIHIDEINYLHAQNNYTWIYRVSGQKYLVSKPIKHLEAMIPYPHFYRTHKSYVVNLKQAVRFVRGQGGYLVLKDETEIPVSRNKKEGLIKMLKI